jgi:predicted ATPase
MQLQVTDGFAAAEAKKAYHRAYELCRQSPDSAPMFPVLWGLWLYSKVRSELSRAQEMANELKHLAIQLCDPDLAVQAHQALGMTAFCRGRPAEAQGHVEQVSSLYHPERHRTHSFLFGQDPAVMCKSYGAVALWLMGYADQAARQIEEAIRMSRTLSPSSQAIALHFAAKVHQLRRDSSQVLRYSDESRAISSEHGFSFWFAGSSILSGWALASLGKPTEGLERLREGLRDWMATDSVTYQTYFLGLLAEVLFQQDRIEDGLRVVQEALELVEQTGERFYEAELYRLRGELLWKCLEATEDPTEPAQCFEKALSVARNQQALSLELRAATSLARLLRSSEAYRTLQEICARMAENLTTPDYTEAVSLLSIRP